MYAKLLALFRGSSIVNVKRIRPKIQVPMVCQIKCDDTISANAVVTLELKLND